MIDEAKVWLEGAFASQQPDGYFGPINERNGRKYMFSSSEIRRFQDENISKNLENKLLEKEDAKWIKN